MEFLQTKTLTLNWKDQAFYSLKQPANFSNLQYLTCQVLRLKPESELTYSYTNEFNEWKTISSEEEYTE